MSEGFQDRVRELHQRVAAGDYGEDARRLYHEWQAVPWWRPVRRRVAAHRLFKVIYPQGAKRPDA